MFRLDLTLPTPAQNLALDEALLEAADEGEGGEVLRFWESPEPLVVLGRSSKIAEEVDQAVCREAGVPILRRCSGGATVMGGPGCLMYALVLSYQKRPALRLVDQAHQLVMGRLCEALRPLVAEIDFRGICDLTLGGRKVSGNALRCKRNYLLYHGTLLYDFDAAALDRMLGMPPRQPDYREGRSHAEFVTNLPTEPAALRAAVAGRWDADQPLKPWPRDRVAQLVQQRYGRADWNERL